MFFSDMPPLPTTVFDLHTIVFKLFDYIRYVFNWLDSVQIIPILSARFSLLDFALAAGYAVVVFQAFIPPAARDLETGEIYNDTYEYEEDFSEYD